MTEPMIEDDVHTHDDELELNIPQGFLWGVFGFGFGVLGVVLWYRLRERSQQREIVRAVAGADEIIAEARDIARVIIEDARQATTVVDENHGNGQLKVTVDEDTVL